MKKKNNKGFFLAETIVVVALITIVMAFVYPNVAKLYDNYSKRANYYDQIQDLYTLKTLRSTLTNSQLCGILNPLKSSSSAIVKVSSTEDKPLIGGLQRVYLTRYITTTGSDQISQTDTKYFKNYDFNKYLTRLRKTTYDNKAYRLVGIFEESGKTRFASIKIYIEGCN